MTDDQTTKNTGPEMGSPTRESFAWTEPEARPRARRAKAREWLAQAQSMIENLATQAAPVVREVGAKAAELAALARRPVPSPRAAEPDRPGGPEARREVARPRRGPAPRRGSCEVQATAGRRGRPTPSPTHRESSTGTPSGVA